MGVISTMMRLGFTLIWRFDIPSGYPCVIVLPTVCFFVLGMQVGFYLDSPSKSGFYLDSSSKRLHCSAWTGFFVIDPVV